MKLKKVKKSKKYVSGQTVNANTSNTTPPAKPIIEVKSINSFMNKAHEANTGNKSKSATLNSAMQDMIFDLLPDLQDAQKEAIASAIPRMNSIGITDFVMNPSSVSISTFQRMSYTDPTIGVCLDIISSLVSRSIRDFDHHNENIQELVRYNLKHLKGGLHGLIKDMMTAKWAGNFVGEKVINTNELMVNARYIIDHVTPLPPITTIFAVDEHGYLKARYGIFQYIINSGTGYQNVGMQNLIRGDNTDPIGADPLASYGDYDYARRQPAISLFGLVEIPTDKCIHFVNRSTDNFNNPYGRSSLRRIYNLYLLKYGVMEFMAMALQFRAFPQLAIYTDGQQQIKDEEGNTTNCYELGREVATQREGASTFVFPGMRGTSFDMQAVDITGDLQIFIQILDLIDKMMYKNFGIAPSMLDGSSGSYAMGYMHDSLCNKILASTIDDVKDCLINQLVADIITKNFNESEYDNFGDFKLQTLTLDDKIKYAKLFELTGNAGITSTKLMNDLNHMREILDFNFTDKPLPPQDEVKSKPPASDSSDTSTKTGVRDVKDDTETPYAHWE